MTDARHESMQENPSTTQLGLFDGFEGYKSASREDYVRVLREGLIVIDANVLLDLYRYGATARNDLLKALRALGGRLWVPHQAVKEFWRNREKVLKDPGGTAALHQTIGAVEKQLTESINNWTNQRSHQEGERSELNAVLQGTFQALREKVDELSQDETAGWARNTGMDEVLKELETVLTERVGHPLSEGEHAEALIEARRRIEHKIPPGYMDGKKDDAFAGGDFLVWEETLREATKRGVDVLVVSRDTKEDWIRREGGESRGPRIELVQEMKQRADVRLFMRTPADLLNLAHDSLNVDVSAESVTNADLLSRELAASERRYIEDERWWKDAEDWDAAAVHWFMHRILNEHPSYAEMIDFAAVNNRAIDTEVLEFFGMPPTFKALREFERAVAELTDETAKEGLVPAQALPVIERITKRLAGQPARVTGYRLRPTIAEFVKLVMPSFTENSVASSGLVD